MSNLEADGSTANKLDAIEQLTMPPDLERETVHLAAQNLKADFPNRKPAAR